MPAVAEYDSVVLRHRPLGAAALEQMVAPPQVFLVRLPDNLVMLWMLVMEADTPPNVLFLWLAVVGSLVVVVSEVVDIVLVGRPVLAVSVGVVPLRVGLGLWWMVLCVWPDQLLVAPPQVLVVVGNQVVVHFSRKRRTDHTFFAFPFPFRSFRAFRKMLA